MASRGDSGVRASDAEREGAVAALRAAAGEGRLDVEELDERTMRAYAATTRGELAALLDDLPAAPLPSRRGPRMPGRPGFTARWTTPRPPEVAAIDFLQSVAPPLRGYGYQLAERHPDRLVFVRERRPAWTIVVAVLVFPVGLLALIYKEREAITVEFARRAGETLCLAQGTAPLPIRREFAQLGG